LSNAIDEYKLNTKQIALSCSSHRGESFHIKELDNWIKKIDVKINNLKCGVHYPINKKAFETFLKSRKKINELYNNCAGKHLAMISSCLSLNYNLSSYLDFNHPHQTSIRKVFEDFTGTKLRKLNFGIDGCSAPQYSFRIKDLSSALNNLIKSYEGNFQNSNEVKILINSVLKYPKFVGGSDSLDSKIMSIANKSIFCKGGAEGVLLFLDFKNKITGVIKVIDGNERALPSVVYNIFKKFKIFDNLQLKKLEKWSNFMINNHAKIKVGSIKTEFN